MSRRISRVDRNQAEIVRELRQIGATVQLLHGVGKGCPDLLVGFRRKNFLIEVKDGLANPSDRRLTDQQVEWHAGWKGTVFVVCDAATAVDLVMDRVPLAGRVS